MAEENDPPIDQISPASPHSPVAARGPRNQRRQRQHRQHRHPGPQPAPAPAPAATNQPSPPANIAPHWVGVDKSQIPQTTGRSATADPAWMGTLIDNSNLRFTGAYVTGAALSGQTPGDFTNSSKAVSRGWMPNMQTLTDQGWGAAFFYVGYSVTGGESAPSTGVDTARGTLHGLHLRTTLDALGANFAGAVVFIDNEDSTTTTLPQSLIDYYNGLFTEMARPDPNLAAFRPGMYGHGQPLKTMLAARKDLFLWDVWLDTSTTNTTNPPFTPSVDPIMVDPATRPLKAYVVAPSGAQAFIAWSVGRQFRFYTDKLPATRSATARRLSSWRRIKTWDFDSAFVRNPAFPEGEPRLAVFSRAGLALVTARSFVARGAGTTPTPPSALLTTLAPGGNTALTLANGVTLEPDAPSALFQPGADAFLCTVLNGGGLGIATLSATGTWTTIDTIAGTVPALRRIRAIAAISRLPTEAMLFMVGADHQLYVKRQQGTAAWEDGVAVNADLRLHPFTRLAATTRGGDTVDTFFIDNAGLLTTAFWARWFTTSWPGFLAQRIETAPSFLPGGDIAAVVPQRDDILVFGVGTDLQLRFAFFVNGQNWTPPASVGQAADLIGAHTRLSAVAVDATHVEVAALTDAGQAVIYPFQRNGTTWTPQPRIVVADPPALTGAIPTPPQGAVLQPADGFRINPFGDLALFRAPGAQASVLYCAGLRGGDAKALMRDLAASGAWQFYV